MLRLLCLFSAVALLGCGDSNVVDRAELESAALDQINIANLRAHVEYLADDALLGREPGEPGYDQAAAYVAEQFAAMGAAPGGDDGWYQQVRLRQAIVDTDKVAVTLHKDGEDVALVYRDDFSMGADMVREDVSIRGEVVYVGYGVHAPEFGYSDYEGVDVRGKIVARFGGAPSLIEGNERAYYSSSLNKNSEAVERGAVGVISLRTQKGDDDDPWEEIKQRFGKRPQTSWVNDAGDAANYFTEIKGGAFLSMPAAERMFELSPMTYAEALSARESEQPTSLPLGVEVSLSRHSSHSDIESPNVIGLVRGTDPELADEYVVYTAHLDHIGVSTDEDKEDRINNGAYDNAMGVALMLETARAFAAAPARRSVLFIALTAEERGLLGSDYFVNNPTVPSTSLVANINLDMPLFLYPLADLIAFGSQHSSLQSVVEGASATEAFSFSPDPIPEENLFVRSDQYSFVRKGIPSVFLVPGFTAADDDIDGEALFREHLKNHYHEPSDDLSLTIEWDSALRFARAHTRIGFVIAMQNERPSWNEGDFFGERYGNRHSQ